MKRIFFHIGLVLACTWWTSCTEYLDIKPYGRTIPKTAEEFSALLHTHLNNIDEGQDAYLMGNSSMLLTWDAECGDDFENCLTTGGGSQLKVYVGNVSNSMSNAYSALYEVIRDCNLVLGEMQEDGTELSGKVRATAYALRAVSYYQLLRLFCEPPRAGGMGGQLGVPIVTTFDMEEKPLRSSMQQTVDRIEQDLQAALAYGLQDDVYRFTAEVCKGYLARLYFWTKQWSMALPLSRELLAAHPLLMDEAYRQMMTTTSALAGNQLVKSYRTLSSSSSLSSNSTLLQYRPVSQRLLSLFPGDEQQTDVRYALWFTVRRTARKTFFCGMRAAEFKLMEAECCYHLGKEAEALAALNALRAYRIPGCVPYTATTLPGMPASMRFTSDAMGREITPLLGTILVERRKEFFLEGDRFFELKRNGSPEFWTALNGVKYVTRGYMYTFPIPAHDVLLVDGLIQNTGYTQIDG